MMDRFVAAARARFACVEMRLPLPPPGEVVEEEEEERDDGDAGRRAGGGGGGGAGYCTRWEEAARVAAPLRNAGHVQVWELKRPR